MKTRYKANTFTAVIRIIIGLMLIGFSVWAIADLTIQKNRCSEEVTGRVVRIEEVQRRSRTEYRPVFEYEYNGEIYSFTGYYERRSSYSIGQTKKLRIDPKDPSDAFEAEKSRWYVYPILIAGCGMLVFGIYTIKKANADKQSEMY